MFLRLEASKCFPLMSFVIRSFAFLFIDLFFHFLMQVYDVTQYLDDHPGGDDVILATTRNFLCFLCFLHYELHAKLNM